MEEKNKQEKPEIQPVPWKPTSYQSGGCFDFGLPLLFGMIPLVTFFLVYISFPESNNCDTQIIFNKDIQDYCKQFKDKTACYELVNNFIKYGDYDR